MMLDIHMFGIAKDIFGQRSIQLQLLNVDSISVDELKHLLQTQQPSLKEAGFYMIAVNKDFASGSYLIREKDAIAIIPPVSGG